MKRIADFIQTNELCSYGCGSIANFINGSKRLMCCKSSNSCPANKKNNSDGLKKCDKDYTQTYKDLPQETKNKMNWSKGLTKEINPRLARPQFIGKKFGISLTGHTEETRKKIADARTKWLKNPFNRKNLGRHKRSWMELTFESYLNDNEITGWDTEIHFYNDELKKNYFPDFIFEDKKTIIELDGNQHLKTIEKDTIRDKWFNAKGYKVIRISHVKFKERYFSGKGFLDLLEC